MAVAVVLAVLLRIWSGAVLAALALVPAGGRLPAEPAGWRCCSRSASGAAIGIFTGFLVSRVGMPSFVVTLALFIAWQGVILQLIGEGGTLGLRDPVHQRRGQRQLSTAGQLDPVRRGRGRLRGGAAQSAVLPARLGLVAQPTGPGADQDRRGRGARGGRDLPADDQPVARRHADRGRAVRRADRAGAAGRGHVRAGPDAVRPPRLRRGRQPGGGPARGHRRRQDPGRGVRDLARRSPRSARSSTRRRSARSRRPPVAATRCCSPSARR